MNSRLGPDLRAMVWKEWRANFKWGLLGLLGVVLAAVYAILHAHGAESGYLAFGTVWTAAETVLTFAAPLLGLLLGLVQIVPEQRRDLWAFLIHRPASRSTIFWGKAIAGIGLLLLATLIPFLGFAIWMRVPGHYPAPFDWRLTLGGLISILSGLVFYFAGMLTALRPARWFGSRALPIPTAILSAAVLTESPTFMMALVLGIFFLTIVAAAAWGSFLTTGLYPRQPRPARFSLGVTVYLGLIVVIVTTAVVVTVSIANFFPPKPPKRSWESYEITKTGRVLRVTNTYGGDIIQAEDLAGRTVKHPNSEADFLQTQSLRPLSIDPSIGSEPYNSSSRYLTLLGTAGPLDSGTIWYYIVGARRIVAYSLHSRREIGRLGPEGFKADDAPQTVPGFREPLIQKQTDQFLMSRPLLVFPHSVSLFDTEAQTMVSLQTVLPPDQIRSLSVYTVGYLPDGRVPDGFAGSGFTRIFIGTDTEITVFTPLGKRLFTLPREYNFRDSCNVEIAMTNDAKRLFFRFTPLGKQAQLKHLPSYLDEVTMTGKLLNRYVLPPLPTTPEPHVGSVISLYGLLIPPVFTVALNAVGYWLHHSFHGDDLWDWMTHERRFWILSCLCSLLAGIISGVLGWLIGRRCVFTRGGQWAWAVGVFWLGLPGLLLLLSLRDWPARETCSNCGRLRVVDRDHCEHCGAGFTPPPRDGTEIFGDDDRQTLSTLMISG